MWRVTLSLPGSSVPEKPDIDPTESPRQNSQEGKGKEEEREPPAIHRGGQRLKFGRDAGREPVWSNCQGNLETGRPGALVRL